MSRFSHLTIGMKLITEQKWQKLLYEEMGRPRPRPSQSQSRFEGFKQKWEKLMYGESRTRRESPAPASGTPQTSSPSPQDIGDGDIRLYTLKVQQLLDQLTPTQRDKVVLAISQATIVSAGAGIIGASAGILDYWSNTASKDGEWGKATVQTWKSLEPEEVKILERMEMELHILMQISGEMYENMFKKTHPMMLRYSAKNEESTENKPEETPKAEEAKDAADEKSKSDDGPGEGDGGGGGGGDE